jgi:hypothetical protein
LLELLKPLLGIRAKYECLREFHFLNSSKVWDPAFGHEPLESAALVTTQATLRCQGYRLEPELGACASLVHVDVRQLDALVAVEGEPRGAKTEHCRHVRS